MPSGVTPQRAASLRWRRWSASTGCSAMRPENRQALNSSGNHVARRAKGSRSERLRAALEVYATDGRGVTWGEEEDALFI